MIKLTQNTFFSFCLFMTFNNIIFAQCIDSTLISQDGIQVNCYYNIDKSPALFKPVCGCDNVTYMNSDCAISHGVKNWIDGPCDCYESKWIIPYRVNFYEFDQSRGLIPRDQVCGCDSITYLSPSSAYFSGITSWTEGVCSCIDSNVIDLDFDLSKCSHLNFLTYKLDLEIPNLQGCDGKFYNNLCEAFYRHGITKFILHYDCLILPESERNLDYVCSEIYNPVCGCNGVTYKNACIAKNHYGVIDYYEGECNCTNSDLIGSSRICTYTSPLATLEPVCGCDGKTYLNECKAINENGVLLSSYSACTCTDSSFVNETINCDHEQVYPWCGCDGNVYKNYCEAIFHHGVMNQKTCNCIELQLIDDAINCNEFFNYDPVCGCNGRTYPNECYATYKAGITEYNSVAKGPCPGTCKDSILSIPDFPCSTEYNPVCGCDNVTYQNECEARYKYGVIKWTTGSCISSTKKDLVDIKLSFFPNPTSGKITIYCADEISFNRIEIIDLNGNIIKSQNCQLSNGQSIDLSDIQINGLYFIKLTNDVNIVQFKVILTI